MKMLYFLMQHHPFLWGIALLVLGLCVGSFLNVVIYRLPIMLETAWRAEAATLLRVVEQPPRECERYASPTVFNLCLPRSHCPACGTTIAARDNIPLVSWLLLRGHCRHCQQAIPRRYPLVEGVTAGVTVIVGLLLPFGPLLLAGLLFSWILIALSAIDGANMQLPDCLTLPLLWLGLIFHTQQGYLALSEAVWGAVVGYLVLWLLYWGVRLSMGKEGLGYGDFKLLAALGAWLGWMALPPLLIIASLSGILFAVLAALLGKRSLKQPIPFGPALALGGWSVMLYQYALPI